MKAMFEPRRRGTSQQSFVAYERMEPTFPFAWHYHPEIELTWIEAGAGTRFVGDSIEAYGPDDLVLLGRDLPHTWSSEKLARGASQHRAIVVQFPAGLFPATSAAPEFLAITDLLARAARGVAFPPETARKVRRELRALLSTAGLEAWCMLARVLDRLARRDDARLLASSGYTPSLQHGAERRFSRTLAFIEENIEDPSLHLAQAGNAVHLTPAAFSRFFQRLAGRSFVHHLTELRVGRACRALVETDRSVAEIAFACGFGNLANFNRRFRELKGTTPREFRARFGG